MMNIISQDMIKEMEQSFLDYSTSVITGRALPDARDGLKPVHRRILYALAELNLVPTKPYKKSARIVGDVIGKYHPHGDSSVYEAMVRMAQDWSLRYPLVEGPGNFGSVDGDGAAAMRYTEARMSKITLEMLRDLKKDVVDFQPNFSEDLEEPMVLPSRIPNLLLNGTSGIAVGMACSFAPHNINEVIDGIIATINNRDITVEELHKEYIKAPDFPTGGTIINQHELLNGYKTGKGRVRIRGKYNVEKIGRRECLVFYEIPYGVKKEKLIEDIAKLCEDKSIEGITDIRDTSNKHGMRIEIEVKKDINPDVIANHLFRLSALEDTYSLNHTAIVNKSPKVLNLKELIEVYIDHQVEVITRRTQFDLRKIDARLHIIEGLLKALEDIDNVIALIKASNNVQVAIEGLMKKYSLSEIQAKAIVEMKLRKLTGLEKVELEQENKELVEEANHLKSILGSTEVLNSVLIDELNEIKSNYGDARKTDITNVIVKADEKDIQYVQPEEVVVVMTKAGNVKKIPAKSFKVQNRNGKGVKNQDDIILDVIRTNTIDTLMVFTALGKMYRLVVDQVPTGTNSSRGVAIHTLVKMEEHDKAIAITSLKRKTDAEFVVSVSEQGMIKKTKLEEYMKAKKSGIAAVGLREGDSIANIVFIKDEQLILVSERGMSIRFKTDNIGSVGRTAIGVRGMKIAEGDRVVAALPINKDTDELAIFSQYGMAKRTPLKEYPIQGRDGKGTITYKPNDTTGVVVSAALVEDKDNVLVVGDQTSICISAKDIPSLGKASLGNIMIKGNNVMSVTKI
ncbi:MAG: DNA gyrase subunit A [Clostridium sp.]|nr:DNA gyrase subunit A [Clostridium sp.]